MERLRKTRCGLWENRRPHQQDPTFQCFGSGPRTVEGKTSGLKSWRIPRCLGWEALTPWNQHDGDSCYQCVLAEWKILKDLFQTVGELSVSCQVCLKNSCPSAPFVWQRWLDHQVNYPPTASLSDWQYRSCFPPLHSGVLSNACKHSHNKPTAVITRNHGNVQRLPIDNWKSQVNWHQLKYRFKSIEICWNQ